MSKFTFVLCALFALTAQAFVPVSQVRTSASMATADLSFSTTTALQAEETYWEGEYPPSSVLGPIMSKMPSALLAMLSIVCLSACAVSVFESGLLAREPGATASGEWVKWYYVLGSFGGPLAWGTHVAAWIQRKNGM
uniref:Uncharacterized protein n=1 Tax=Amphora coffeiformis TaxID=265554 RepID=A0A7S3LAS7_9STRA|eukprot:scaffold1040_cov165-Amphora_coffeaeformis.AAC.2